MGNNETVNPDLNLSVVRQDSCLGETSEMLMYSGHRCYVLKRI